MRVDIIQIGKVRGICLPNTLLNQFGFTDTVDLCVEKEGLLLRPVKPIRLGWDEAFRRMAKEREDILLDDTVSTSEWDAKEWEWK